MLSNYQYLTAILINMTPENYFDYKKYLNSIQYSNMLDFTEQALKYQHPLKITSQIKIIIKYIKEINPTKDPDDITIWLSLLDIHSKVNYITNFTELWWKYSPLSQYEINEENIKLLLNKLDASEPTVKLNMLIQILDQKDKNNPQLDRSLFDALAHPVINQKNAKTITISKKIRFLTLLSKKTVQTYIFDWFNIEPATFKIFESIHEYPKKTKERNLWLHSFINLQLESKKLETNLLSETSVTFY